MACCSPTASRLSPLSRSLERARLLPPGRGAPGRDRGTPGRSGLGGGETRGAPRGSGSASSQGAPLASAPSAAACAASGLASARAIRGSRAPLFPRRRLLAPPGPSASSPEAPAGGGSSGAAPGSVLGAPVGARPGPPGVPSRRGTAAGVGAEAPATAVGDPGRHEALGLHGCRPAFLPPRALFAASSPQSHRPVPEERLAPRRSRCHCFTAAKEHAERKRTPRANRLKSACCQSSHS
mmetsp:Transcript_80378/g.247853  ORF Transcript_80378/g.247853 Transcript_80378/m.247853 type:complete len:238 (+) Transcript_80378:278-991(+)